MRKTILTVILYDKTFKESLTLNCLMNKTYVDIDLLIINNGPKPLEFDKRFIHTLGFFVNSIKNKEFLDNRPLSWIYNGVINEYHDYDRFIFLDDDSILTKEYIKKLDQYDPSGIDLQIPNIRERTNGMIYYPLINKKVKKFRDGDNIPPQSSVLSIGSGLVIHRSLVDKFSEMNMEVFDSRFALYGVDYSFFNRIELLKKHNFDVTIQVVGTLDHSLSRVDEPYNQWRTTERLYDSVLSVKYYSGSKVIILMRMIKLFCKQLIKLRPSYLVLIIKTFIKGKHPRC
ncbi:hypothetical protein [Erwinia rhapontici]|uniref:hypothetical protein n=1 Tax=Erwinia TaxID=551 RepID=UPI00186593D1|nr:hypothetical protein [Erwinia rhapontici]MBP2156288.1 hypothetical protein [Erwinia rhapontici]